MKLEKLFSNPENYLNLAEWFGNILIIHGFQLLLKMCLGLGKMNSLYYYFKL